MADCLMQDEAIRITCLERERLKNIFLHCKNVKLIINQSRLESEIRTIIIYFYLIFNSAKIYFFKFS